MSQETRPRVRGNCDRYRSMLRSEILKHSRTVQTYETQDEVKRSYDKKVRRLLIYLTGIGECLITSTTAGAGAGGFSGTFCAIFWLKQHGSILPVLCFSKELISRDEEGMPPSQSSFLPGNIHPHK
jgi:hypothetical protein